MLFLYTRIVFFMTFYFVCMFMQLFLFLLLILQNKKFVFFSLFFNWSFLKNNKVFKFFCVFFFLWRKRNNVVFMLLYEKLMFGRFLFFYCCLLQVCFLMFFFNFSLKEMILILLKLSEKSLKCFYFLLFLWILLQEEVLLIGK